MVVMDLSVAADRLKVEELEDDARTTSVELVTLTRCVTSSATEAFDRRVRDADLTSQVNSKLDLKGFELTETRGDVTCGLLAHGQGCGGHCMERRQRVVDQADGSHLAGAGTASIVTT